MSLEITEAYEDGLEEGRAMTRTDRAIVKAAEKWFTAAPCRPGHRAASCPRCQWEQAFERAMRRHFKAKSKQKKGRK